jgi:hypothetical protein
MISHASGRQASASSMKKSLHEQVKTFAGSFHFFGALKVGGFERTTVVGSWP